MLTLLTLDEHVEPFFCRSYFEQRVDHSDPDRKLGPLTMRPSGPIPSAMMADQRHPTETTLAPTGSVSMRTMIRCVTTLVGWFCSADLTE